MRYILLITAWMLVYYGHFFYVNWSHPSYIEFLVGQVSFSFILFFSFYKINQLYPTGLIGDITVISIICLTTLFAAYNLLTMVLFLQTNYVLYDIHPTVSGIINALEFMILILGSSLGLILDGKHTRLVASRAKYYLYRLFAGLQHKRSTETI